MKLTMHAITMSMTAALALQSGYAHGFTHPMQAAAGSRMLAGEGNSRAVTIARETEPGDDRGAGKGEPQPGDRRRGKGKPRAV